MSTEDMMASLALGEAKAMWPAEHWTTVRLNTTDALFAVWLRKNTPPETISTTQGNVTLHTAGVSGPLSGRRIASMTAAYEADDTTTYTQILLEITPLASERIKVLAGYGDVEFKDYFTNLLQRLTEDYPEARQSAQKQEGDDIPSWVPRNETTRDRWREAANHIAERKQEQEEGWLDRPTPTYAELAEHLGEAMHWRPSEKTIGRIIKAAEEGWI